MQRSNKLLSLLSPQTTQNRLVVHHLGSGCAFALFYLLGLLVAPVSPPFLLFLDPRSETLRWREADYYVLTAKNSSRGAPRPSRCSV